MKKVYKVLPLSIYDIPGVERWLAEQANAGLFPVFLHSWAVFIPAGVPGTRFHLMIPALSLPVAQAQLDAYRLVNLEWSYAELSYPGLDFAIYATEPEGIWQMLAIGREGRVAVFRYAGREQLAHRLPVLSEAVS